MEDEAEISEEPEVGDDQLALESQPRQVPGASPELLGKTVSPEHDRITTLRAAAFAFARPTQDQANQYSTSRGEALSLPTAPAEGELLIVDGFCKTWRWSFL